MQFADIIDAYNLLGLCLKTDNGKGESGVDWSGIQDAYGLLGTTLNRYNEPDMDTLHNVYNLLGLQLKTAQNRQAKWESLKAAHHVTRTVLFDVEETDKDEAYTHIRIRLNRYTRFASYLERHEFSASGRTELEAKEAVANVAFEELATMPTDDELRPYLEKLRGRVVGVAFTREGKKEVTCQMQVDHHVLKATDESHFLAFKAVMEQLKSSNCVIQ